MAVLVLEAFAGERGPAGRGAYQEALATRIGERPDEVAHALQAEHRVVDVERDHGQAVVRVGGAGRGEGAHRTALGDALLENLAALGFLVIQEHLLIDRVVELSLASVDADLAKQRFHAERAGFVGNDGHHLPAQFGVAQQQGEHADEGHGSGDVATLGTGQRFGEIVERRRLDRDETYSSLGKVAAQFPAALLEITDLGALLGRTVERDGMDTILGDGNLEAAAEVLHLLLIELFLLVGDVAALAGLA